jgi:hypothetical protein
MSEIHDLRGENFRMRALILDANEELSGEAEFSCSQYETIKITPGWRDEWRQRAQEFLTVRKKP